jgi:hypothetical protein
VFPFFPLRVGEIGGIVELPDRSANRMGKVVLIPKDSHRILEAEPLHQVEKEADMMGPKIVLPCFSAKAHAGETPPPGFPP